MEYSEILPSPHLRHLVKCFWSLTDASTLFSPPETVLPDGKLEIIFNLADRFRRFHADGEVETQPGTIVVGQMRRAIQIQSTGKVDLFGVRFETTGAYYFLKRPLSELTDSIVPIDRLVEKADRCLEEQINEAGTTADRVAIFERILSRKLRGARASERIVDGVKGHIRETLGQTSILQLSRDFGVSQRQLERYFKEMVGVSPKFYSRITRLQGILNEASRSKDMLELALSRGYYDQSHFIREFVEFTGKSPTAFMQEENRMSEAFSGA